MIRVFIVCSNEIVRQALRILVDSRSGLTVVGETANGRDGVILVERLGPDIVLMDLVGVSGLNSLDATRQVVNRCPNTRVVIFSGLDDYEQVVQSLRAGARGYLAREAEVEELFVALQVVIRGNLYFSAPIVMRANDPDVLLRTVASDKRDILTGREREVLQLIAEGHTNQGIANMLVINVKTVEAHKAHIMTKLHARTRTDLIRYALRHDIIRLDPLVLSSPALVAV